MRGEARIGDERRGGQRRGEARRDMRTEIEREYIVVRGTVE